MQPDPVQHRGDQAYFCLDLSRSEWRHVAGIDRLLQMGGEGGEVVGIAALDEGVGRVLDMLDQKGLRESTLVMFISDMGAILRPGHGLGVASNAPFRDGALNCPSGVVLIHAIELERLDTLLGTIMPGSANPPNRGKRPKRR